MVVVCEFAVKKKMDEKKMEEVTVKVSGELMEDEEEECTPKSHHHWHRDLLPLDVDYLQAALHYAVADRISRALLFQTLETHANLAANIAARSFETNILRPTTYAARSFETNVLRNSIMRKASSGSMKAENVKKKKKRRPYLVEFYARHRMLACASLLVALQCSLMHQVLFAVRHRSCSSSRGCSRGTSCSGHRRLIDEGNRCEACNPLVSRGERLRIQAICFQIFDSSELIEEYNSNNLTEWPRVSFDRKPRALRASLTQGDVEFSPSTFVEFCSGCIDSDGTYKPLTSILRDNVRAMQGGDFLTLLVCTIAVGLTIVGELREIKICTIAQRRCFAKTRHHSLGHAWFALINSFRAYLLVPQVIAAVPRLVLYEGGNTVSLIFNTVSIIFVTELDNLLTQRILSPSTVATLENTARVMASREDLRYLAVTQKVFVVGVVIAVFLGLFAEVRYFPGISFAIATFMVYIEGLAELVVYDSEQPLLTRILFTTGCYQHSCCCDPCYCRRNNDDDEENNNDVSCRDATTADAAARNSKDNNNHQNQRTRIRPPVLCAHLRTVSSHRRRRHRFFTVALCQDIIAYTFELFLVSFLVGWALDSALQTNIA